MQYFLKMTFFRVYLFQPYRTSPLVLPGAKVSRDPAPTMSYLRHHPNPMMRSGPAHYEWVPIDIAKKQQVNILF